MPKTLPKLASMEGIIATAARQQEGFLAPYACRSYPIPAPGLEGLQIRFLYAKAAAEREDTPRWIGTPEYIVSIDAETAKLAELRAFHPSEIGLQAIQWLGQDHAPVRRKQPDFADHEKNLYLSYDAILPAFAASLQPVPNDVVAAAHRFSSYFGFLLEPPLLPYYQTLGGWFFGRINLVKSRS